MFPRHRKGERAVSRALPIQSPAAAPPSGPQNWRQSLNFPPNPGLRRRYLRATHHCRAHSQGKSGGEVIRRRANHRPSLAKFLSCRVMMWNSPVEAAAFRKRLCSTCAVSALECPSPEGRRAAPVDCGSRSKPALRPMRSPSRLLHPFPILLRFMVYGHRLTGFAGRNPSRPRSTPPPGFAN